MATMAVAPTTVDWNPVMRSSPRTSSLAAGWPTLLATTILASGAIVTSSPAQAHQDTPVSYVALGDSAAAGPRIPDQATTALGCLRSTRNYPSVIAAKLGVKLRDVTCSSARTNNVGTSAQTTITGRVPPQIDALGPSTNLVTLTIGANDIDLFSVALRCINLGPLSQECSGDSAVRKSQRAIVNAARGWGRLLDEIHGRAPKAAVIVVGYGTYIRSGGCPSSQPFTPSNADYLQGVVNSVNAAMSKQTHARRMTFVDIRPMTVGHDVCADSSSAYYTGATFDGVAVPLHPTALGMRAIGAFVADRMER